MPKDNWSQEYGSLVELGARIGVKIRERDDNGSVKLTSAISQLLQDYQKKLDSLRRLLHKLSRENTISDLEFDRRQSMVDELSAKYEQLQKSHKRGWSPGTTYNSMASDPWEGGAGPGSARRLSAGEIRAQQQAMMNEQDDGLEELSKGLRRQKQMGFAMQDQIAEHNVLIDDIHEATSVADNKIRLQTRRVEEVRRKDSCKCSCALWTIIILLAVAILIIAFVPYKGKP